MRLSPFRSTLDSKCNFESTQYRRLFDKSGGGGERVRGHPRRSLTDRWPHHQSSVAGGNTQVRLWLGRLLIKCPSSTERMLSSNDPSNAAIGLKEILHLFIIIDLNAGKQVIFFQKKATFLRGNLKAGPQNLKAESKHKTHFSVTHFLRQSAEKNQ